MYREDGSGMHEYRDYSTIITFFIIFFTVVVTLSTPPPVFEGGSLGIVATSPLVNLMQITITNITFTINGRPTSEITGLNIDPVVPNMAVVNLIIRNIPASLNGNSVSCTAELSTGDMASCTPQTLQVQGNSP